MTTRGVNGDTTLSEFNSESNLSVTKIYTGFKHFELMFFFFGIISSHSFNHSKIINYKIHTNKLFRNQSPEKYFKDLFPQL